MDSYQDGQFFGRFKTGDVLSNFLSDKMAEYMQSFSNYLNNIKTQ